MKATATLALILIACTALATKLSEKILLAGELEILGDSFTFTEGPAADAKGNVYFTDLRKERIHVYTTSGKLDLFRENTGGANGLYFAKDGSLYVCEGLNGRVTSISTDGKVEILADTYNGNGFNKPNDLWIDPNGGVYFTDPAYGRTVKKQDGEHVYYLVPDRSKVICVIDDFTRPNGVIGTPDGKMLFVADHGAGKIWKYSIHADGTLANKSFFAEAKSDGMTLDVLGNLYATQDSVLIFNPEGKLIEEIKTPNRPTNVTFGGEDNRTLFITARTHVCSIKMNVEGAR
jgi:gluconolactonase